MATELVEPEKNHVENGAKTKTSQALQAREQTCHAYYGSLGAKSSGEHAEFRPDRRCTHKTMTLYQIK